MIKNRKRKAFTIVELVIVIAVIAILAAVLIPTFAGIIARANESADIQAVRQMNMALLAESVEDPPDGIQDVINILAAAGYNAKEKLIPVSSKHGFYWCEAANMITLIRDEGNDTPELIFPLENAAIDIAFDVAKADANKEINFGGDKATASANRTFYDLEQGYINYSSTDTGTTSNEIDTNGVDPIVFVLGYNVETYTNLRFKNYEKNSFVTASKDENGNITITLGGACTIDEAIIVSESENVTIDLNGKTLMVNDPSTETEAYNPITVLGTLNIVDSSTNKTGTISINEESGANANAYRCCGICVGEPNADPIGELNFDGVRVTCNREWNIYSKSGTLIEFTDVVYTIHGGFGLYTDCTTNITGGSFIAAGENVTPLYNSGGNVTIDGTTFSEPEEDEEITVSYGNNAPICSHGGTLTLQNDVMVDGDTVTADYSVYAAKGTVNITGGTYSRECYFSGSSTKVTIESGIFNGLVTCGGYATATIENGTFNGEFTCNNGSNVTISGGTFTKTVTLTGSSGVLNITGGTFAVEAGAIVYCTGQSTINITGGQFKGLLQCSDVYEVYTRANIYVSGTATIYYNEDYVSWSNADAQSAVIHGAYVTLEDGRLHITRCTKSGCDICAASPMA